MDKPFHWSALVPALLLVLSSSCVPARRVAVAPPASAEPSPAAFQKPQELTPNTQEVYEYLPKEANSLGTEARLSEICKQAAGKVYYDLKDMGEHQLNARVAVVSAVPLSDLKRPSEFGRLMAEDLLTNLADRGVKVTELRMGKDITILPQTGEFIMTRNVGELANDRPHIDYVVITTFSNTPEQLIVQGRLVRLRDSLVETSWRYTLPLNRDLLALFGVTEQPYTIAVRGVRPESEKECGQP